MSAKQASTIFLKSRKSIQALPSIFHLMLFLLVVVIAVMSFNFEVFRVIRIGDLFIIFFAFLIGIQWYGQRMMEAGYQDGVREATESIKSKRK